MRNFPSALLLVLALLLNSCSDTTSPDETNGSFAITSIDIDSAYWGEEVTLALRNATGDDFSLFVHTLPIAIERYWVTGSGKHRVSFRVPTGATSGQIRLYSNNTLAQGEHSLTVFPKSLGSIRPNIDNISPSQGYTGDVLLISGQDLPMRWKDLGVSIGNVQLPIVSWDSNSIAARITENVKSGTIAVRLFDQVYTGSNFTLLNHSRSLLQERTLSTVILQNDGLQGTDAMERFFDDTVRTSERLENDVYAIATLDKITSQPAKDSVVFLANQSNTAGTTRVELRLKPLPESRVSGVIRIWISDPYDEYKTHYDLEVKNMRWRYVNGVYTLYAHASEIDEQLVGYYYQIDDAITTRKVVEYRGGGAGAYLSIELRP